MKKVISLVVRIVFVVISFYAGAIWMLLWWTNSSEDENRIKDTICKRHNITFIDKYNNVYGKERKLIFRKKSNHAMNKIGF